MSAPLLRKLFLTKGILSKQENSMSKKHVSPSHGDVGPKQKVHGSTTSTSQTQNQFPLSNGADPLNNEEKVSPHKGVWAPPCNFYMEPTSLIERRTILPVQRIFSLYQTHGGAHLSCVQKDIFCPASYHIWIDTGTVSLQKGRRLV